MICKACRKLQSLRVAEGPLCAGSHGIGKRIPIVEAGVEVHVFATNLEANNRSKGCRLGGKASVTAKDVVRVRNGRLHGRRAWRRDFSGAGGRAAPCALARSAAVGSICPELRVHEGKDRILHRLVLRRAELLAEKVFSKDFSSDDTGSLTDAWRLSDPGFGSR
jgi:hypothetical protein